MVVTVNKQWDPCSAIYPHHCLCSYLWFPIEQQHSLSFISLVNNSRNKWIFFFLSVRLWEGKLVRTGQYKRFPGKWLLNVVAVKAKHVLYIF